MVEFKEGTYILGYWYGSSNNDYYSIIATKYDNEWQITLNFSYNNGEEKRQYVATQPESDFNEEKILKFIDEMLNSSIMPIPYEYTDHFLVHGDFGKFMEIVKTKDYLNIKEVN
jgi:hypothetical protein